MNFSYAIPTFVENSLYEEHANVISILTQVIFTAVILILLFACWCILNFFCESCPFSSYVG